MQEFLRQKIKSRLPILIFSGLAFFVWSFYFTLPDGRLHLKFYNVGQGDSIFIETPAGYQVLIDGGPDNKVLGFLGFETLSTIYECNEEIFKIFDIVAKLLISNKMQLQS